MAKSGIYRILNDITKVFYLGSATNLCSVKKAEIEHNISSISDCLSGRTKMAAGFKWQYL